jgi:hypothetical protein
MMTFLLSNSQRRYLESIKKGTVKRTPKTQVQRNMECAIRKKLRQPMKDLTLMFETLTLTELKFYEKDYFDLAVPLMRAIQNSQLKKHFWKTMRYRRLSDALEAAGKRHDYKRLVTDEKYRQRMIDWLAKNGVRSWEPMLEEEKEFYEKIKSADEN